MTEAQAREHVEKGCVQCRGYMIHLYKKPCPKMHAYLEQKEKKMEKKKS